MNKIFRFAILVSLAAVLPSCASWLAGSKKNVDLKGRKEVYVDIPTGSDFTKVMQVLTAENVLIKPELFEKVALQKDYDTNIKPGRYKITDGMTNKDLVNLLKSGRQSPVKVSFHYVRTLPQLCGRISRRIEADSLSLLEYLSDNATMEKKYGMNSLTVATLFIPNTYEFYWNTNAEQFTDKMYREYQKFWNDERKAKAQSLGLTQVEVSILASIVQAEQSKYQKEWPTIAGVYVNRLQDGMLLQSDPTVVFATGEFTLKRVLNRHLEIESPYNTYKHPGLPPGPIMIPEPEAIDAVLDYEKHNYYYMCAKDDLSGYHNFASTLTEHNYNSARYRKALNRNGIY